MKFKKYLFCFIPMFLGLSFLYAQEKNCDCYNRIYEIPGQVQKLYNEKKYLEGAKAASSFWTICNTYNIKNEIVYITVYNTACCWSLSNVPDSAFNLLNGVISDEAFLPLFTEMGNDGDLENLHSDSRWKDLIEKGNVLLKKFASTNDSTLIHQLQTIRDNDQKYRSEIASLSEKKSDSSEIRKIWKIADVQDSIDMVKVSQIINEHGWPGPKLVGFDGNKTVFLVIQHAPLKVQLHYLPLMKKAVKDNLASPADLAFLEDRILLREHKEQIYGTQLNSNFSKAFPIKDSSTVDCRRFKVGLVTMDRYINNW